MIRYHKSQINEHQLILILHSLCNVLPTKTPSKLTNSLSMQGIDISRLCLDISDTFPVFRLWPERGETWELSGQWLAMEAAQAVSAAPGCPSGHQHRPMVSSTGAGVSVSVGPSQSAELPTIEQQQIQFTVELRRAMSSTHTWCPPPCHMCVWSYTLMLW